MFWEQEFKKKLHLGVKSKEAGTIRLNVVTSNSVLHPEDEKGRLWITTCLVLHCSM